MISRRHALALFCAPALVRVTSLMPVKALSHDDLWPVPSWCPAGWLPCDGRPVDPRYRELGAILTAGNTALKRLPDLTNTVTPFTPTGVKYIMAAEGHRMTTPFTPTGMIISMWA